MEYTVYSSREQNKISKSSRARTAGHGRGGDAAGGGAAVRRAGGGRDDPAAAGLSDHKNLDRQPHHRPYKNQALRGTVGSC